MSDTKSGSTAPDLRMDAYYYEFTPTGVRAIDLILSAVACAGKAFHETADWRNEARAYDGHTGSTPVEWIQNAANAAAQPAADTKPAPPVVAWLQIDKETGDTAARTREPSVAYDRTRWEMAPLVRQDAAAAARAPLEAINAELVAKLAWALDVVDELAGGASGPYSTDDARDVLKRAKGAA